MFKNNKNYFEESPIFGSVRTAKWTFSSKYSEQIFIKDFKNHRQKDTHAKQCNKILLQFYPFLNYKLHEKIRGRKRNEILEFEIRKKCQNLSTYAIL